MDRFSTLNVGRLDSVGGVGQSTGAKAPSLASFLSQRANQVLGARQTTPAAPTTPAQPVESQPVENEAPAANQESNPVNPQLARQMEQLQRLHSSISLPSNYQGISVLV